MIDRREAEAERLEQERERAIAAADIEDGIAANQRREKAAAAGEEAIEQRDRAEAVPMVPAGLRGGGFGLGAVEYCLKFQSVLDHLANFQGVQKRTFPDQAPDGCERHSTIMVRKLAGPEGRAAGRGKVSAIPFVLRW